MRAVCLAVGSLVLIGCVGNGQSTQYTPAPDVETPSHTEVRVSGYAEFGWVKDD